MQQILWVIFKNKKILQYLLKKPIRKDKEADSRRDNSVSVDTIGRYSIGRQLVFTNSPRG